MAIATEQITELQDETPDEAIAPTWPRRPSKAWRCDVTGESFEQTRSSSTGRRVLEPSSRPLEVVATSGRPPSEWRPSRWTVCLK